MMTTNDYTQAQLDELLYRMSCIERNTRKPLTWLIVIPVAVSLNVLIQLADIEAVNNIITKEHEWASKAGEFVASKIPKSESNNNVQVASQFMDYDERTHKTVLSNFIKQNSDLNINPSTTAWCAGFVNGVLGSQGIQGTGKLNAKSFLHIGESVKESPQKGDIVVFDRGKPGSWQGHVGFYMGEYQKKGKRYIEVLGGNQGKGAGKVSIDDYNAARLIDVRRVGKVGISGDWLKAVETETDSWIAGIKGFFKKEKSVVAPVAIMPSINSQQWAKYTQLIACHESRSEKTVKKCLVNKGGNYRRVNEFYYMGRYQLGAPALCDAKHIKQSYCDSMFTCSRKGAPKTARCRAWRKVANGLQPEHGQFLKNTSNWTSTGAKQFLKDKSLQDQAFQKYTRTNIKRGYKNGSLDAYSSTSEILAYAAGSHLKGHAEAKNYVVLGRDSDDRNGTRVSHYVNSTKNYLTKGTL